MQQTASPLGYLPTPHTHAVQTMFIPCARQFSTMCTPGSGADEMARGRDGRHSWTPNRLGPELAAVLYAESGLEAYGSLRVGSNKSEPGQVATAPNFAESQPEHTSPARRTGANP